MKQENRVEEPKMSKYLSDLRPEGSTMNSLYNSKWFKENGYNLVSCVVFGDKRGSMNVSCQFSSPRLGNVDHVFTGFNMGYGGEGPHGLQKFIQMWYPGVDDQWVFDRHMLSVRDDGDEYDMEDLVESSFINVLSGAKSNSLIRDTLDSIRSLKTDAAVDASTVNVDAVPPEAKDFMRASNLRYGNAPGSEKFWHGSGHTPVQASADKMAAAIKDTLKLVRRTKAVVATWGNGDYEFKGKRINVVKPFVQALERMQFSSDQIRKILAYRNDAAVEKAQELS